MSSSRRVKKGPGRRPQSAKRRRFVELRERGWRILAAAREVGVSRTTGNNWSRGYKTYRRGQVVGFVPALERLAVREVSARFLSQDERIEIADLRQAGLTIRQIAGRLGRAPSTVSRELRRNAIGKQGYRPFEAHRLATTRRHQRRVEINPELRTVVGHLLAQRWSPQQVSRHLRRRYPDDRAMWLCHESIYQAIYQPGSVLKRPSPLAPHRRSPLRTGRDHRRAHQRLERRRPRFEEPMRTIHERPFQPEDRSQAGHWEGDLIIGKDQQSAIGTLVERRTLRGSRTPIWAVTCVFACRTGSVSGRLDGHGVVAALHPDTQRSRTDAAPRARRHGKGRGAPRPATPGGGAAPAGPPSDAGTGGSDDPRSPVPAATPGPLGFVLRHPGHRAALAPRPSRTKMDLPTEVARSAAGPPGDPRSGPAPRTGEPDLGPPPDPRRTRRVGLPGRGRHRLADPAPRRRRPRPPPGRHLLAHLPVRAGLRPAGLRLLHGGHRVPATDLRVLRRRTRHPPRSCSRGHQASNRGLGHPTCTEPADGPRGTWPPVPVPPP
ncbi:hypothetical protein FMEAI12_1740015 [Parafrankia sp. Ea1.12]|nr:hypothetical protein FMEAI12_1740015 [Parafrankia sp. Ea1.12]